MSDDALRAAELSMKDGHWRSCVSRAYYAAYCAATHEITQKITTFSHGWNNPAHERVPTYIQSNLSLPQVKKDIVIKLIVTLRLLRIDADYRPNVAVEEADAKNCIRDASDLQRELW